MLIVDGGSHPTQIHMESTCSC